MDDELESIISRLDDPHGRFPADAIEEARKRSEEMIPPLIKLIEDATHDCRLEQHDDGYGHFYGAYLLTEFRAREAWPAILNAISLPGEKPYELFGDAITEDFGCIIGTLAGDHVDDIDGLIADRSLDEYVRWTACEAILYRIRDGLLTREDAIDWLARHLEKAIENQDEVAEGLALRLEDLAAEHKLPLIKQAFAAGLIDAELCPLDEIQESIVKGDETFEKTMARLHDPVGLIDHLQRWSSFEDHDADWDGKVDHFADQPYELAEDDYSLLDDEYSSSADEYLTENDTTVRNEGAKIGRNDKCPCGSGKKFKKCCGRTPDLSI